MLPRFGDDDFDQENLPETRGFQQMLPPEQPDRIHVAFDDHRLAGNAGLFLPVTLVRHPGLGELVNRHIAQAVPLAEPTSAPRR